MSLEVINFNKYFNTQYLLLNLIIQKEGLSKLRESMKEIDMKLQSIQEMYPTSNSKRLTLEYINTKKLVESESPSQLQNEGKDNSYIMLIFLRWGMKRREQYNKCKLLRKSKVIL